MDIIIIGFIAGIVGTITMDVLNGLFSRVGLVAKIEAHMIGRMVAGWTRGRFRYGHPEEMTPVANERLYGYLAHYGIGVGLAVPFFFGWYLVFGELASPLLTVTYGIATTAASYFFVYPCMGQGIFGLRSQDGRRNVLTSLANHSFFAVGMAAVVAFA